MSDSIDLGDIPVPDAPAGASVGDTFSDAVAFNMAFIGVGQGGSRIAQAFHKLGYRRVCALNLNQQDLAGIAIPETQKLDLDLSGAAKDRTIGAAAVADKDEEIYDLLTRSWGTETDYALVCFGAGGGTGSGAYRKVVEVAQRYMMDTGRPARVGIIVAMPKDSEGKQSASNTLGVFKELSTAKVPLSPLIVVDNERIETLFPKLAVAKFNGRANDTIAAYLHTFNRLAAQPSEFVSFDRKDLGTLLDSGAIAYGLQVVSPCRDGADIGRAVREQLANSVLASVDLSSGKSAGLIFLVGEQIIDTLPQTVLDHGFSMLGRILRGGGKVFHGVYKGKGSSLYAFTMVGSLPMPVGRLTAMAAKWNLPPLTGTDTARALGV